MFEPVKPGEPAGGLSVPAAPKAKSVAVHVVRALQTDAGRRLPVRAERASFVRGRTHGTLAPGKTGKFSAISRWRVVTAA